MLRHRAIQCAKLAFGINKSDEALISSSDNRQTIYKNSYNRHFNPGLNNLKISQRQKLKMRIQVIEYAFKISI